ncbi:hypothetical protein [Streptomyces sp. MJP52]|uniref:DUF7144 family membrane protein n=1 Tax=Streptomyces sp. MJP52 TaxID=2940555 RepID=UPI0024764EAB|nr:hypothetical protein [Streptomyces sp. MJP52]MDH6225195.1 hypothetical protein [Streptomyces sp. MJP52]
MTETHHRPAAYTAEQGRATGLYLFATVMLLLVGLLEVLRGIMGIAGGDVFVTSPDHVFRFDLTGWSWIHLALGLLAALVAVALFQAARWARVAGVAVAGFVVVACFLSLPYAPLWSVVVLALSGFVVRALCVVPHGRRASR